jgi:hypothetical protein
MHWSPTHTAAAWTIAAFGLIGGGLGILFRLLAG